jgi:hypothetical protein
MPYSKFSLKGVKEEFDLEISYKNFLSEKTVSPSDRLLSDLEFSSHIIFNSEKARSEFLISPILRDVLEKHNFSIALFSGESLDVEPEYNLNGECDFILTNGVLKPLVESPIFTLVEAKKSDLESGLGQVIAQMVGADILNERNENEIKTVFGAVTTGEIWQFLKLHDKKVEIELRRFYISDVSKILGAISEIVDFYKEK